MRKNTTIIAGILGIIIGILIGVFIVFPGIYAWNNQLNFFETWYNMFVPIH